MRMAVLGSNTIPADRACVLVAGSPKAPKTTHTADQGYTVGFLIWGEGYRDSPGPTLMLGWSVGGERAAGENF